MRVPEIRQQCVLARLLRILAAGVILATLAIACTSPSGGAPAEVVSQLAYGDSEMMPDGCILISPEEVERISGHTLVAVLPFLRDSPGCQYTESGGLVLGMRFRTKADGLNDYEIEKARADAVLVSGIGDEAIWIPRARNLMILEGEWVVAIGVGRIGEDDLRFEKAKEFAALIVPMFK